MLTSTYIHIKGVSQKTEKMLWNSGFRNWWQVLEGRDRIPVEHSKREILLSGVIHSVNCFMKDNVHYFSDRLKHKDIWRILVPYMQETGFLDIETDRAGEITLIGLFIGNDYHCYLRGGDSAKLEWMLSLPRILVTFNGMLFDVPVIKKHFPYIRMPSVHFDLHRAASQAGWSGGLKKLEKKHNIQRPQCIMNMTGYDAVKLWESFMDGNRASLDTLIEYNKYDVKNLKLLIGKYIEVMSEITLSGEEPA